MGDEVEARSERVRHHLRRPDQPGRKLINGPDQIHRLPDRPESSAMGLWWLSPSPVAPAVDVPFGVSESHRVWWRLSFQEG